MRNLFVGHEEQKILETWQNVAQDNVYTHPVLTHIKAYTSDSF